MIFLILKDFYHQAHNMRIFLTPPSFLTDTTDRLGVLLTLMFFAVFPLHALSAGSSVNNQFISNSIRFDAAEEEADHSKRLDSMLTYAKQELPHLMPGLPSFIRDPAEYALGGLHETTDFLSFDLGGKDEADAMASILRPVTNLLQPAAPDDRQATWVEPNYHHRNGVLPLHDAIVIGTHSRKDLMGDYMRIDIHPYVAQNMFSQHGYYGADISFDLAAPRNTTRTTKPWGKVVFSYTNGDSNLMDHGRGADLHGELRFSDNLTLNSGMRQSDTTGASDYVLLQWKLTLK